MKLEHINGIDNSKQVFKGQRVWKNTITQLTKNNPYSLTEPNQRRISDAIKAMAQTKSDKNIKFLLSSAAKVKYSTNIQLKDTPRNNWKGMLLSAAATIAALAPLTVKNKVNKQIETIENNTVLNKDEKEILNLREQLLKSVDLKQIQKETKGSAKDFGKNLDYFIVSSETTLKHKKYVLERLNYMMSDKYKINPQLKDKKSIAVAEMINDMAIHTPGNDVPNIKAIDQKSHGMCAAISIVRKKLTYEDKPNYVDAILSELDSNNYISVYDRTNLGSGHKVKVAKVPVDFNTALSKGYRIIDASALHWMQIADMGGSGNISYNDYHPFDTENFDVNADSFFNVKIDDPELSKAQEYYQALCKAKDVVGDYKAKRIKKEIKTENNFQNRRNNLDLLNRTGNEIRTKLRSFDENLNSDKINELYSEILALQKSLSADISKEDKYSYIPNEEEAVKKEKIRNFLADKGGIKDVEAKEFDSLYSLIEYANEIKEGMKNSSSKASAIRKARDLYEVAAAYRHQMLTGLNDSDILIQYMSELHVPDRETLLLDTFDRIINELEKNSNTSDLILEQLAPNFKNIESKEDLVRALSHEKENIEYYIKNTLGQAYHLMEIGGREDALRQHVESLINTVNNGDKEMVNSLSQIFDVKPKKSAVLAKLEALHQRMVNGDKLVFDELFCKLGDTSQIVYVSNLLQSSFQTVAAEFFQKNNVNDENLELLMEFSKDDPTLKAYNNVADNINSLATYISNWSETLRILDKNGATVISASLEDAVIRKLEEDGEIIPAKDLRELQNHFTKIDQDRSTDEFQSRQGKLKDKTLYNFSDSEKAALKKIEKNVDAMYSNIKKEFSAVQRDMKDSLEELKRVIGLNNGSYWVSSDGHSGLFTAMQIRLLEYITDRPHYENEDIKGAIETIKTTPYSGISSSSVYHNDIGMHAQYIADIAPVTIKTKDKDGNIIEETKDVLFNDNSWGASENENTWVDSNGIKRTDYSNNRGGTQGYVTNSEYRNGNFVDRILNEMTLITEPDNTENRVYKRIKHTDDETYKMPQYSSIIVDGKSSEAKKLTDEIHDAIFNSAAGLDKTLKALVENHSEEQLKNMIKNLRRADEGWQAKYQNILSRIFPVNGEGIKTEAEYNSLPDNDYLKVVLEKIALKDRGQIAGLEPELAEVRTVKGLSKFKAAQKNRAINSFKYAFGKTTEFIDYVGEQWSMKEEDALNEIYDKYGIKLTDEEENYVGCKFSIDMDNFDGNIEHSIQQILQFAEADVSKVIKNEDAKKEIMALIENFVNESLYFNKEDINNPKIKHIIDFIDRVYDPVDDDDLVRIYREIQNMDKETFKKEIMSKVTAKDLGLKTTTGYDVLKKIEHYDSDMNNNLMNTVYYDTIGPALDSDEYKTSYKYNKFSRSARYKTIYNFNTTYREMGNALSELSMPKLFNKYKDRNIMKYGVYPAYPKISYITENVLNASLNSMLEVLYDNTEAIKTAEIQKENYQIAHKLARYNQKLTPDTVLSDYQYKNINMLLGKLITNNFGDYAMEEPLDAAEKILELPKGTKWGEYQELLSSITDKIFSFENTTPTMALDNYIASNKLSIKVNKEALIKSLTQKRYQSHISEMLNKLEQAYVKGDKAQIAALKDTFRAEVERCHILQKPEELLESFSLSCAKDSELNKYNETFASLMQRGLVFATLAEMEEILMKGIKEGVELDAKKLFDDYNIELSTGSYTMGSDEIIEYMINKLIIDDQNSTALMFIDKLGLGDAYIRRVYNNMDFEENKKLLVETYENVGNYSNFQNTVNPSIDSAADALTSNGDNYLRIINALKNTIRKAGEQYSVDKKHVKILLKALDNAKEACDKNPEGNRALIFNTLMNQAKTDIVNSVNSDCDKINNTLRSTYTILEMINQILVLEKSEAEKQRAELNQKYAELLQLRDFLQQNLQEVDDSDKI